MFERVKKVVRKGMGIPGAGAALVSLAAAIGLVVGVRSVIALELPGWHTLLGLPAFAHETIGLSWTDRASFPAELQASALDRIGGLVAALLLAAASVSLLDALVLLLDAGASRRREVAIRAAVGAAPRRLAALLLNDVRRVLGMALALGLLLGLATGGALRGAWPGTLEGLDPVSVGATLLPVLVALLALATFTYLRVGLRVARSRAISEDLGAGGRVTADRGEAFRRRTLSAVQMGAAGAVTLGTIALALAVLPPEDGAESVPDTVVIAVTAPAAPQEAGWAALLSRLGDVPGLEAESLSTPGTLVGLGVRDYATAQCGRCVRGGLPLPFVGERADHHAVAPGYFAAAGIRVVSGRDFTRADGADAPRVAIVNRTFANSSFEGGQPIGHLVRLGRASDAWFEVVGVVDDPAAVAVGGDDLARAAVYVSALQQPPTHADVLVRGPERSLDAAVSLLATAGYTFDEPRTLAEVRRHATAPLLWTARLALALGLLTLVVAVHGSGATALQITRRRVHELAVRRVLGATDRRLLAFVLAGSARGALWGAAVALFFGALLVGLLEKAASGVPALGPEAYAAVVALLVGSALLASAKAVREALAVEPARALE